MVITAVGVELSLSADHMTLTLRYDPLDPTTLSDPYPLYAELREKTPIFWHDQMKSWVLTRYRDCRDVLRDYELFARDRRRVGEDIPEFRQSVQSMDPPDQGPLRNLLISCLRSQDLDEIGDRARRQIKGVFDRLADSAEFDLMGEIAAPLALTITSELFGVEEPELSSYMALSDAIARRMDAGLLPQTIEAGDRARNQLNSLVERWFDAEQRPGILTDIRRNAGKAQVPEHYIRNTTGVMFNASYGTIFATIGNVVLTLLQHGDALDRLRDRSLLASGVQELIRFDGPAQGTSRVATRSTTIGDAVIEPGQIVMTLLAAANRDPEEFPRPDELVLDRSPNRHLAFGWGPHACLGAMFGQIAVRELIVGMLSAPAALRLAGTPTRRHTATVRSVDVLPVTLRRPARSVAVAAS